MNVRARFACFQTENCTYLDSAATTQVPDVVLAGIARALVQRGNPNRSAHRIAERSHALLEEAKSAKPSVTGLRHPAPIVSESCESKGLFVTSLC